MSPHSPRRFLVSSFAPLLITAFAITLGGCLLQPGWYPQHGYYGRPYSGGSYYGGPAYGGPYSGRPVYGYPGRGYTDYDDDDDCDDCGSRHHHAAHQRVYAPPPVYGHDDDHHHGGPPPNAGRPNYDAQREQQRAAQRARDFDARQQAVQAQPAQGRQIPERAQARIQWPTPSRPDARLGARDPEQRGRDTRKIIDASRDQP